MFGSAAEVALATDLYQLTMGASYAALGMRGTAVFSLFVRALPPQRSFLVAAGLAEALERVRAARFDDAAIAALRALGQIRGDYLDRLAAFRFRGDIWAVPEGRVVFPREPLLEVAAPIGEAQLVETLLVNALHFPTTVATKAARCRLAAPAATLIDFGLRRTPGIEAGLTVARAAYLAGFDATSNVLAGVRLGIPVAGTVAHSFVETFPAEIEAFRAFAATFPGPVTLLIDTYDTIAGARRAAEIARELAAGGGRVAAVRLDSGDLATLSAAVRRILDGAGLTDVRIVASGGLDEDDLAALAAAGAPIDAYGVGTRLGTAADAPVLDMAYKLVEYDGQPCLKLSTGKATLIGPKQVWRRREGDGFFAGDLIAGRDEPAPGAGWEPLLLPVMRGGEALAQPSLSEARGRCAADLAALPPRLRSLNGLGHYPVALSDILAQQQAAAVAAIRRREGV
jgi:nicotinate phosphoribosyltransferase